MIDVTPIPPAPPSTSSGRPRRSRLVQGIVLMALGAWLLAANLGWSMPYDVWNVFPLFLITAGVIGISFPSRHIGRARGAWLLGIGLYLACGMFNVFGLGWGSAWPILLIGAGLGVMLDDDRRRDCRVIHGS
jgi:hypothetical protein